MEPHPTIYNLLKLEEIMKMRLAWIPSTLCTILGFIMYLLNNITNMGAFCNDLWDWLATAWFEQEYYWCSSGTTTHVNIAKDDNSISTFDTAVADLATHCAQDNTTMRKLSETNQSMQTNLNNIIQELQTSKHQMNYSNAHAPQMRRPHQQLMQHSPWIRTIHHLTSSTINVTTPSTTKSQQELEQYCQTASNNGPIHPLVFMDTTILLWSGLLIGVRRTMTWMWKQNKN